MCLVSEEYRDLSRWEAFEAMDNVYVGGAPVEGPLDGTDVTQAYGFPLIFACQTKVEGFSIPSADGILGFSSKQTSFVNQMYQAKALDRPAFSLCFSRKNKLEDEPDTGSLTLGGFDPSYHLSQMTYAKNTMVAKNSFSLYLRNVFIRIGGGESVKPFIPGMKILEVEFDDELLNSEEVGGVAFDTTTPYTLFSNLLSEPFKQAWTYATGEEFTYHKVKLTEAEVKSLPTLILQLKNYPNPGKAIKNGQEVFLASELDEKHPDDILIAFPASHYMEYNSNTRMYRPRISFENMGGSILGSNLMQGHDITFDLVHDRIGFAETNSCTMIDEQSSNEVDTGDFSYADDLFTGEIDDAIDFSIDKWGADDIFLADDFTIPAVKKISDKEEFACDNMMCKSYVGFGYFFGVVFAWVIYKCTNIKTKAYEVFGDEDEVEKLQDIDFPSYEPEDDYDM